MNTPTIIFQLTTARKVKGWTQQDLAEALGVSQPVVASMEAGKSTSGLPTLEKWAVALGYTLDLTLTLTTERSLGEAAVFTSYKGGVGQQALVLNLAACLAAIVDPAKKVLLLDFDLYGEMSSLLGIPSTTVLANGKALGESVTHLGQLNLWIGLSSRFSSYEEALTPDTVAYLLAAAKREFDYVIINGPSVSARYKFYQKEVLGGERIVAVTSQYAPDVYGGGELLQYLQNDGLRVEYVVNQVVEDNEFSELDVRRVLCAFPCLGSVTYSAEWRKFTEEGFVVFGKHIPEINAELYTILRSLYHDTEFSRLPELDAGNQSNKRGRKRRARRADSR